ncbi:MAG: bifunctional folylpolyglutamate synthase/dihydrofolate synthase [Lachnospiraceae bacterium]|nr:bifunctional folylpolyglutamate synthase/dihydrofolate synthase [Lachnospiraceae bacterium]
MNYQETLDYIASINWKGSVLGLERIRTLLNMLGNPQKDLKFVHIGGTNGKGSTAAFTSSVLVEAGLKVGLFISPYIEVFNERMQINNEYISADELAEITSYIRPFADSMEDKPTEFELNTAISLVYYQRNACDIVVFEVGMGGELDSTNVIDSPEVAVITAIGLDHTVELGDTIEKIAATKSGIIKEGCSTVLYKQVESVTEVIAEKCKKVNSRLYISEPENVKFTGVCVEYQSFEYPGYGELRIPLIGGYQLQNVAVALKVIEALRDRGYTITEEAVRNGLAKTKWPGRFEVINKDPLFIVDGAHNPHGIKATTSSLKDIFKDEKLTFIFGVMADKDYMDMVNQVAPLAKEVLCVTPDNPRALEAAELAKIYEGMGIPAIPCASIGEAVDMAFEKAGKDGIICALGSLYQIGDIKRYKKKNY